MSAGAQVPVSLIVDDPAPLAHVYRWHAPTGPDGVPRTRDGRRLVDEIPTAFLDRFCDLVDDEGVAGKFSIVPAPAWRGDVVRGVNGDLPGTVRWLETARRRLGPRFDFCPECITHDAAVDLATGTLLDQSENDWSQAQDRSTLAPYLAYALRLLKEAGIDATGVTSPWVFGEEVETEYVASLIAAQRQVYGRTRSWFFLHMLHEHPEVRPWVAHRDAGAQLVSVPSTTDDAFWQTIDSPRADDAFVSTVADYFLSADGSTGQVRRVLDAGGWPILLSHWQSLYSNGLETGLRALAVVAHRVNTLLARECRWATFTELMERTLAEDLRRPSFLPLT